MMQMSPDKPHALGRMSRVESSGGARWPSRRVRVLSPLDRWCLGTLARRLAGSPARLVLWDGTTRLLSDSSPEADIIIRDRATLLQLLWQPDLGFGEAYMAGRIEIDGDLVGMLTGMTRALEPRSWAGTHRWRRRHGASIARASRNAERHYDLGNAFYRRWLDADLAYTCAYFESPECSLEHAQQAKHEYVARKLALQPGDLVYEAGCGWGGLALYLARARGVSVRAWNVSHEQIAWARERARREGLADRVEFIEGDYRTIEGRCDAFVAVGMLEHVGARQYEALGGVLDRCLDEGHGRGLLHFIGRNTPGPMSTWVTRYIFPGAYIPSLREVLERVLEPRALTIVDVENLRPHYALTLAHWLERFEAVAGEVSAEYGEAFTRMWRLYLAEAQAGFRAGHLQLFQVTFTRSRHVGMPWTRARLYDPMEPRP